MKQAAIFFVVAVFGAFQTCFAVTNEMKCKNVSFDGSGYVYCPTTSQLYTKIEADQGQETEVKCKKVRFDGIEYVYCPNSRILYSKVFVDKDKLSKIKSKLKVLRQTNQNSNLPASSLPNTSVTTE